MAIGDQADVVSRLKALLPNGWFEDSTPVLDGLLNGLAWALALIFSLITYAGLQTRIATATDGFLDLISLDFFGTTLPRRSAEMDAPFRARILASLLREKATRKGMIATLTALTGRAPIIFEPARPADTGAYGVSTSGYGLAGGYGSLLLPYQCFMTAFRPAESGIPNIAGYGVSTGGYSTPSQACYADISDVQGVVTDADIFSVIAATAPVATIEWTRLSN